MNSTASGLNIALYGHESAEPAAIAQVFDAHVSHSIDPASDCAIFVVNPAMGIDQATVDLWQGVDLYQTPRILLVTNLEDPTADFDDGVILANRLFDQMATPYLVLHDDAGLPAALISLTSMQILDYSTNPARTLPSEPEHELLVQEFRDEYLELTASLGEGAFAAGLLFPAIPIWLEKGIGVDIVKMYLEQLKK